MLLFWSQWHLGFLCKVAAISLRDFSICFLPPLAFLLEAKLLTQWGSQFRVSPNCLGLIHYGLATLKPVLRAFVAVHFIVNM